MTAIDRDKLLGKIRALLSKTVENGCSEQEAMAALAKARAMMDAYEVTESDLQMTAEEKAVLERVPPEDPHSIKQYLAGAIAEFCGCTSFRARVGRGRFSVVFCGLPSDTQLATWMLDALTTFVRAELASHLLRSTLKRGDRRRIINGFVGGCCTRIAERIRALAAQSRSTATGNGRALVVLKDTLIADAMSEINVRKARRSTRTVDGSSYRDGRAAGERASLVRPVSPGKRGLLG